MSSRGDGLVQRRNVHKERETDSNEQGDWAEADEDAFRARSKGGKESGDEDDDASKETRLSLLEEVLLLGLKDKEVAS